MILILLFIIVLASLFTEPATERSHPLAIASINVIRSSLRYVRVWVRCDMMLCWRRDKKKKHRIIKTRVSVCVSHWSAQLVISHEAAVSCCVSFLKHATSHSYDILLEHIKVERHLYRRWSILEDNKKSQQGMPTALWTRTSWTFSRSRSDVLVGRDLHQRWLVWRQHCDQYSSASALCKFFSLYLSN